MREIHTTTVKSPAIDPLRRVDVSARAVFTKSRPRKIPMEMTSSTVDREFKDRDRALEAPSRLAESCVQMEQTLRPTGTDSAQACPSGNLLQRAPRNSIGRGRR